jgi:hypothetical protein
VACKSGFELSKEMKYVLIILYFLFISQLHIGGAASKFRESSPPCITQRFEYPVRIINNTSTHLFSEN